MKGNYLQQVIGSHVESTRIGSVRRSRVQRDPEAWDSGRLKVKVRDGEREDVVLHLFCPVTKRLKIARQLFHESIKVTFSNGPKSPNSVSWLEIRTKNWYSNDPRQSSVNWPFKFNRTPLNSPPPPPFLSPPPPLNLSLTLMLTLSFYCHDEPLCPSALQMSLDRDEESEGEGERERERILGGRKRRKGEASRSGSPGYKRLS